MTDVHLSAETTGRPHADLLVEIDHVVFGYDASRTILNDVSLAFGRGKVTAILGGSGCGKTTLLRLIGGVYPASQGTIRVEGKVVDAHNPEQLFALRRRLGMLFQFGALFTDLSVFENVAFPLREHTEMGDEEIARAVRERLELVNLPNTEHLMPVDLPGGMRKRVGLARSIVLDPKMILYDEPTTGLDPITAQKINEMIIDLQTKLNVTSVVVTHDIQSAFSVGDRIAFLNKGVFEWVGTMDEARDSDHPILREFFKASAVSAAQPSK